MRKYWTGLTALIVLLPGYAWAEGGDEEIARTLLEVANAWWELLKPAPKYQPWLWIPIVLGVIGINLHKKTRGFVAQYIALLVAIYLCASTSLVEWAITLGVIYVPLNMIPFLSKLIRGSCRWFLSALRLRNLWGWIAGVVGAAGVFFVFGSETFLNWELSIDDNPGALVPTLPVGCILFSLPAGFAVYRFIQFLTAPDRLAFLKGDKKKADDDKKKTDTVNKSGWKSCPHNCGAMLPPVARICTNCRKPISPPSDPERSRTGERPSEGKPTDSAGKDAPPPLPPTPDSHEEVFGLTWDKF